MYHWRNILTRSRQTWKDKTLDYEIETTRILLTVDTGDNAWKDKTLDYEIETLDRRQHGYRENHTWKDKTLDYEIETMQIFAQMWPKFLSWKDKTLDYEIETIASTASRLARSALEKIRLSITRLKLFQICGHLCECIHLKR